MSLFIPTEKHISLLDEIGRWKVIGLKELFKIEGKGILYSSFARLVQKLESEGFIQSFQGHNKKKYLSLSIEGGKYSHFSSPYAESKSELRHDLIVSNALRELLKFENFKSGHVVSEELDIVPDALIYASRNGTEYSLALEVELHQKSKKRIVNKFSRYARSQVFNYVLYVTNKSSILDCYKTQLTTMKPAIQDKILILNNEYLSEQSFDYENSNIWLKGEFKSFKEVFG